jgi:hypothetical protein
MLDCRLRAPVLARILDEQQSAKSVVDQSFIPRFLRAAFSREARRV